VNLNHLILFLFGPAAPAVAFAQGLAVLAVAFRVVPVALT